MFGALPDVMNLYQASFVQFLSTIANMDINERDSMSSMEHVPWPSTKWILAGRFTEAARWAAKQNHSLREWVLIESDAELQIYRRTRD